MTANRSRRTRVLAAVALGLLLGLQGMAQEPDVGPEAGQRAPDFTLPDLDGSPHSLSSYRGRKVFLATWASW